MSSSIQKRDCVSRNKAALLGCFWLVGIFFGTSIFFFGFPLLSTVLPSICSLFFGEKRNLLFTILPFLLSAFAVSFRHQSWLFLICCIKATLSSFNYGILCLYYGQAGWIARWIFSFADICSMPLLFFYWLRNLSPSGRTYWQDHIVICIVLIVFLWIDYRFISPFGAKIGIL